MLDQLLSGRDDNQNPILYAHIPQLMSRTVAGKRKGVPALQEGGVIPH